MFLRAYRGLRELSRAVVAGDVAVPDRRQRLPEPRQREKAADASRSTDRQFVDERRESAPIGCCKDERAARVRAAIAQLPRKQRATLILRMYHEMSHQEIADVLGSSVGAVKANFFHALGNLKKLLGDEVL